ncbi:transporter substrate-binding domain-containing protein [Rhodobacterales bacterium]|nr:transporter substrate-binding domain-containing protein [Rhodobacterales bacterium]
MIPPCEQRELSMKVLLTVAATMTAALAAIPAHAGPVMDEIVSSDKVICLVNPNSPGFSVADSEGVFHGFNTDFCRMAAAAILGDAEKADMRGVGFSDALKTLVAGGGHMASRSITQTGTRDADPGLSFVVTTFYDGQGFMVPTSLGVNSARELGGATICAEDGSTTLMNIADWFTDQDIEYRLENIADKTARLEAFFSGKCDVYASDITALFSDRLLSNAPLDYKILPEVISAEPLTLVTRPDKTFETVLFWAFQVMLNADHFGINSTNIDEVVATLPDQPKAIYRLFADDSATVDMARNLGIPEDWAYQVIKQVGSYSEVFDRNLGRKTVFGVELNDTSNALTRDGGQMFAYPIR